MDKQTNINDLLILTDEYNLLLEQMFNTDEALVKVVRKYFSRLPEQTRAEILACCKTRTSKVIQLSDVKLYIGFEGGAIDENSLALDIIDKTTEKQLSSLICLPKGRNVVEADYVDYSSLCGELGGFTVMSETSEISWNFDLVKLPDGGCKFVKINSTKVGERVVKAEAHETDVSLEDFTVAGDTVG